MLTGGVGEMTDSSQMSIGGKLGFQCARCWLESEGILQGGVCECVWGGGGAVPSWERHARVCMLAFFMNLNPSTRGCYLLNFELF
jgi:hypothetical protein